MRAKHVFGLTPWGRFFIGAMEALADEGRLARGRSYAGNGAVLDLSLHDGVAIARVAGNYRPFYTVTIHFKPLPEGQAAIVRAAFDADPLLRGRVAAGELPTGLLERLEQAGVRLLPSRWSEMARSCDCPDSGDPCKHQAAVYYVIAQEIDRDPFCLFRLRGVDLGGVPSAVGETVGRADPAERPVPEPVPVRLVDPWPDPDYLPDPLERAGPLAPYVAAIPSMLPPSRGLAPFDLRVACTAFYHRAAASAPELLAPPEAMDGPRARAFAAARFDAAFARNGPVSTARVVSPAFSGGARDARKRATGGGLGMLEASRLFAACGERDGSASYRFMRALFAACRSICSACAFAPDLRERDGRFSVVWKPARFGSDVDAMLSALEPLATAPRPVDGGPVPDPRSLVDALVSAFLTEYAAAVGYAPASVREREHPAARALFGGRPVPCSAPGRRSLPGAIDAWLSVYDMAASRPPLELKVSAVRGAEGAYRLSAAVIGPDGSRLALRRAARSASGVRASEATAFAAMLSNFVPALGCLGVDAWAALDERELAAFVVEAAPLLARFGVGVVLPKELRALARPVPALRARKKAGLVTYLDLATAFSFDWTVAIGDERLSPAEFSALLESGLALVRWRGRWVRLDPAEAARVLSVVRSRKAPGAMEALRLAVSGEAAADGELGEAVGLLVGAGRREADDAPVPASLQATLRPYQERGYRWMLGNFERGLGCLLADDMGLGKTVQTIAAVLALKEAGRLGSGALVCAPASLLTNWERELGRFAPSLSLCVYYGRGRARREADVTLTSYETLIRDREKLAAGSWSLVVLDEAHYIKNPSSTRARAIKSIHGDRRLALTGTPVENDLSELWSVFDFALPGYLGTLSRFSAEFRGPIELSRSEEAADTLRRAIAPFVMRRLKTDDAVAADLPDKVVVNEYAALTPAQAALYEAIASEGLAGVSSAEPEERLGRVLALITALKQASNHPRNYDKESPGASDRSGKSRLLVALLESAFAAGERAIVFSQYVEMLDILSGIVRDELGVEPYLLHGGMAKRRRDEQVDRFQSERGPGVFLVSLRAGGVGLNLTAATRVVHYDLWFNPAVESQATDRAFRIGQRRDVFVHRLIARDTIEERIDAMISSKRALSELTVRSGESWIGDLSDDELRALVAPR
ncbi:MAG: DEAD/DEAH box helicase family protein [Spirochaetaceae bacterium]|nr:DEAD/DEAH box helicase family protein [Spirochaetaceae bacterium]